MSMRREKLRISAPLARLEANKTRCDEFIEREKAEPVLTRFGRTAGHDGGAEESVAGKDRAADR
jgi:hypothetical protein